jgi:glycine/D-amino acid oxidase-like deaminating enzyme/nitrite reductase/ring-hydroxylating ferredoxin subunit
MAFTPARRRRGSRARSRPFHGTDRTVSGIFPLPEPHVSTARTLPVWRALDAYAGHFLPPSPHRVDVLVVGAGIAGLVTAVSLLREGRRVVVVDRQGLGAGETLRTTAHLASALDDRFHHLARLHGRDGARLAAASHAAAIDWIEAFLGADARASGFRRIPGYLFAHDGDPAELQRELEAATGAGLDVRYLEQGLPALQALGPVLEFDHQARVDIDALLARLMDAALGLGGRFVLGEVAALEGGAAPVATLRGGEAIHASAIVLASNVPFHERVPIHTKQAPYRTYVVAGEVGSAAIPDALIWDNLEDYHYVRLVEDRERPGTQLVMVGGEDHKTGQDQDPTAFVRLQAWTRARFPGVGEFRYGWSGQVLEPSDGLAFIGPDPGGEDNVYVITGDSGNGITHGTLGGLLVTDLVQGRGNPWAELYDPRRRARDAGEWLHENANVGAQYGDWLRGGEVADASELAPGQGAILRRGIHRIAVYRNGNGDLRAFSARCTHMGCAVRWSPQEKSWDCPCHGSRFDVQTGAVLNGPAHEPLAPVALDEVPGADAGAERQGSVPAPRA